MKQKTRNVHPAAYALIPFLLIGGFFAWKHFVTSDSPELSDAKSLFAQCLTEKGVKMYGAFWCPHCKKQKEEFGIAFKNIAYIECYPNNGSEMSQECKEAKIEHFPTWFFPDGSRVEGEQKFDALAKRSGCPNVTP